MVTAMAYTGKQFEEDFKKSAVQAEDISIDRLYDNVGGYAGVKNICDFIVYRYPHQYYFELKSHKGNRLPFSEITEHQWSGLLEKAMKNIGCIAGVLIHYSDHDKTVFVDIRKLEEMKQQGEKSIAVDYALANGVPLDGRKKRVTWEYYLGATWFLKLVKYAKAGGVTGGKS